MPQIKTNNSYLADKVWLRVNHLPKKQKITVLDLFAGYGLIWQHVKKITGKDILRVPVDKNRDIGWHIQADSVAISDSIDFSRYDVIDVDAYGMPARIIKNIIRSGYKGIVFATFIQTMHGAIPHIILNDLGIHDEMINKAPSIYNSMGWKLVKEWLADLGIIEIYTRSANRKNYLFFSCAGISLADYSTQQGDTVANRA